ARQRTDLPQMSPHDAYENAVLCIGAFFIDRDNRKRLLHNYWSNVTNRYMTNSRPPSALKLIA
ncbi:MAG: hypothetical protein Q8R95_02140, partial [Azonexus sp.]|nr:hypothetical protein [Azonexus sp.]